MIRGFSQEYKATVFRIIALPFGALCNLVLAQLVIMHLGVNNFASYSFIIALSAILVFGDIGLGTSVFNEYKQIKTSSVTTFEIKATITVVFTTLCAISLLIVLSTLFLIMTENDANILTLSNTNSFDTLSILVISLTAASIPFSIGARKLHAQDKLHVVVAITSLTPVASLIITFFTLFYWKGIDLEIALIPGLVLFLTNTSLFIYSRIWKEISIKSLKFQQKGSSDIYQIGLLAITISGLVTYLWFIPRTFANVTQNATLLKDYALVAILLLPLISISNVYAQQTAVMPKVLTRNLESLSFLKSRTKRVLVAMLGVSISILVLSQFAYTFEMVLPKTVHIAHLLLAALIAPLWQIPMASLTFKSDLVWLSKRIVPTYASICVLNLILLPSTLISVFYLFIFPLEIMLAYFAWRRVLFITEEKAC